MTEEHDSESGKAATSETGSTEKVLARQLLADPVASDDRPGRRWAYPLWATVLVSAFVLYHTTILLVHNLPGGGLSKGLHRYFNDKFEMATYMRATGNSQSWAMFAPNPHRSNMFMKVLVKDAKGEVWDMKHDIYGRRTYPYTFYDRMGKINRRIISAEGYRRHYAAWVCREWERTHEGEAPEEVQFIKMWTRIPPPNKVFAAARGNPFRMGFDPMKLHLHEREEETIRCRTTRHGQLPNYLRERYGFEPIDEKEIRNLEMRTWWDQKEAERRRKERNEARTMRPDAPAAQGGG